MQFFLTEKRLEKSCLILQSDLFSVYQITIAKTGQYYIGVTQDLKKRVDDHMSKIGYAISDSDLENNLKKYLRFHLVAADLLRTRTDADYDYFQVERVLRKALYIKVLAVIKGKKYGYALGEMYISDSSSDELCLNQ